MQAVTPTDADLVDAGARRVPGRLPRAGRAAQPAPSSTWSPAWCARTAWPRNWPRTRSSRRSRALRSFDPVLQVLELDPADRPQRRHRPPAQVEAADRVDRRRVVGARPDGRAGGRRGSRRPSTGPCSATSGTTSSAALARLRPEFRRLVVMRYLEDLSYEDIAEIVGLPLGTVKSHLHRARAALGRLLADSGWGPGPAGRRRMTATRGRVGRVGRTGRS